MPSPLSRIALPLVMLAASNVALAADAMIREHRFDLRAVDTIEIHASAGSIDIEAASGDELEVILRIEGKDEGWFAGQRDVSEIDLEVRERKGRLILEQTAEDTETQWRIRLPAVATTRVNLGAGSITGDLPATRLDLNLGVGEVDVDYPEQAAGVLHLKVGVGDAGIRGAADIEARRAFVSQDISASGSGDLDVDIDVGVGNIELQLL